MEDGEGRAGFLVLVVDASEEVRRELRAILEEHGCECQEAGSGRAGLALAHEVAPDLILLDARLPDVGGLEVARLLKAGRATRRIPVALLCGPGAPLVLRRGVGPWPSEILRKPVDPLELAELVVRARRTRDARQRLGELGRSVRGSPLAFAADGPLTRRMLRRQLQSELDQLRREGVPIARLWVGFALATETALDRSDRHALANQVAERIRGCTRPEDLVAAEKNDAFVVLLPGLAPAAARMVAEKVRASLEASPFLLDHREVRVAAQIGIVHSAEGADDPDGVTTRAVQPDEASGVPKVQTAS